MGRFVHRSSREIPVDRAESRTRGAIIGSPIYGGAGVPPAIITQTNNPERDISNIATAGLDDLIQPAVFGLSTLISPLVRSTLPEVEDYRLFNPDSVQPRKTVRGSSSSMKASPSGLAKQIVPIGTSFRKAAHVIICVRRHARRASILAKGKGGAAHRPPRKNPNSDTWC